MHRGRCSFLHICLIASLGSAAHGALRAAPALAEQKLVKSPFVNVLAREGKSRALCQAQPNRIFVQNEHGSECIAYYVTKGHEQERQAVLYFDGDMAPDKYTNPKQIADELAHNQKGLQIWADKLGVRYVYVSRVGLNGSSGNHGNRRLPYETHIMNTAIDLLKEKLGLDRIALAGQSGGSTIAASLLSMGRRDVDCAVLGSGAFEVVELHYNILKAHGSKVSKQQLAKLMYDPAAHVAEVPDDPKRRIIIIGDTTDTRTPFEQQARYMNKLRERGHHALLIPIEAAGDLDHGAAMYTIPTAGGCLAGTPDERLLAANDGMVKRTTAIEAKAARTATAKDKNLIKTSAARAAKVMAR